MNTDDQADQGWIDAHSHIWTPDVQRYPLAAGQTRDDLQPPSFTTQELLDLAGKHHVRRVVLIQHQIYYGTDNRYMLDAARQFPDTFRIVGTVDQQQPHPDRAMRQLLEQHVTGFRITPGKQPERWLDTDAMQTMWQSAAQTRQSMCCLLNPPQLSQVDAMCEKFPDTPVVIDHFGRVGIDGMIRETDVEQLCRLARHRHTYVKVSAFYALGKKQPPYHDLLPMIRRLCDAFGTSRLMWASDCPYQVQGEHSYAASLALIQENTDFLSAAERVDLLRNTARKVFFERAG